MKVLRRFQQIELVNPNNEIILNTPNRNAILNAGPPENSKCNILGRGAYGTVFKAIFQAQKVAVKIVPVAKDVSKQSLLNEAHILGWQHQNIIKILKVESRPSFGIVIMERFNGPCLQNVLDTVKLSLMHRALIALDILSALMFCHKNSTLHLDVKPPNVLVSFGKYAYKKQGTLMPNQRNYICKLCDFGSSTKTIDGKENFVKASGKGTVRYMSPEALRDEGLTVAADIYSLGITMWQLKNQRLPYHWIESNEAVAYQVVKNNLRPDSRESLMASTNGRCFEQLRFPAKRHVTSTFNCKSCCSQKHSTSYYTSTEKAKIILKNHDIVPNDYDDTVDNLKLHSIFLHTPPYSRNLVKENLYEEIYKSCWHDDFRSRPIAVDLQCRLEDLL